MKFNSVPGEFAFKALYRFYKNSPWELTATYFCNQKEVTAFAESQKRYLGCEYEIIWPVEVQDGQIIYIPDQSELE